MRDEEERKAKDSFVCIVRTRNLTHIRMYVALDFSLS